MSTPMSQNSDATEHFPRAPLFAIAALISTAFVLAFAARQADVGTSRLTYSAPLEARQLRFEDRADGAVVVFDAADGQLVNTLAAGTNGFVRIVMRGLARDRLMAGAGAAEPFVLTRWQDGRLSIADPSTGRQIELKGFGSSNEGVFAQLLKSNSGVQP